MVLDALGAHDAAVWLFGSCARGEVRQHSDIDIAILPRDELPLGFFGELRSGYRGQHNSVRCRFGRSDARGQRPCRRGSTRGSTVAELAERLTEAGAALATLEEAIGKTVHSVLERDGAILRLIYTFEALWKASPATACRIARASTLPHQTLRSAPRGGSAGCRTKTQGLPSTIGRDRNLAVHMYRGQIGEEIERAPRRPCRAAAPLARGVAGPRRGARLIAEPRPRKGGRVQTRGWIAASLTSSLTKGSNSRKFSSKRWVSARAVSS